eukprot:1991264-Lingulodinium_polyedra.AAC.1
MAAHFTFRPSASLHNALLVGASSKSLWGSSRNTRGHTINKPSRGPVAYIRAPEEDRLSLPPSSVTPI